MFNTTPIEDINTTKLVLPVLMNGSGIIGDHAKLKVLWGNEQSITNEVSTHLLKQLKQSNCDAGGIEPVMTFYCT